MRRRSLLNVKKENNQLDESLVDAWIFSGLRNEDAPDSIVGEKGIPLTCHNFAWNEEGSGFKDGALWFDGVDDVLRAIGNVPALTDYTIIVKREIFSLGNYTPVVSKFRGGETIGNGAFIFELNYNPDRRIFPNKTWSYGDATIGVGINDITGLVPELISYQTKNSYNGHHINSGDFLDGTDMSVGALRTNVGGGEMAAYYIGLYSRSLTEFEIQSEIEKLEKIWSNRLNNN